ncbi:MAG: flagellar brake protein [Lysinibacillus sp.]
MELKIGTMLILEPTHTDNVEKLRCKVVEQNENYIYIDYPVNTVTKRTAFLLDGAQFRATFHNEAKQSFAFNTEVLGRKQGNIPMIMLASPPDDEFIKVQRREYVRVETPVDVAVEFDGQFSQYATVDISAGGLLLNPIIPVGFTDGNIVQLTVVLPYMNGDIRYVMTDATVIRVFERDNKQYVSMQFKDMDDLDKQYIVRFCFERQLQLRRKDANMTN